MRMIIIYGSQLRVFFISHFLPTRTWLAFLSTFPLVQILYAFLTLQRRNDSLPFPSSYIFKFCLPTLLASLTIFPSNIKHSCHSFLPHRPMPHSFFSHTKPLHISYLSLFPFIEVTVFITFHIASPPFLRPETLTFSYVFNFYLLHPSTTQVPLSVTLFTPSFKFSSFFILLSLPPFTSN